MNNYVIKHDELSANEYIELWNSVWDDAPSLEQVDLAMKNTLFRVSIFDKDRLIGMARVIGDKGLSYYIKDVVVIPEYQGKGIGRILINELLKYVNDNGIKNTDIYVELCAMPEVAGFYEKCGFYSDEGIRLKMWYEVK